MRKYYKIAPGKVAGALSAIPAKDRALRGATSANKAGTQAIVSPATKKQDDELTKSADATEITREEARAQRVTWDKQFAAPGS